MKTKSISRSAFFNPRALIGFVLCSLGFLLSFSSLCMSGVASLRGDRRHVGAYGPVSGDYSQQNAGWPQYGFDPEHTSFNPEETLLGTANVSSLQVAWRYSFPCSTYSSPVVVDGVLYAGSY